jgi:hypothetical protein
MKQYYKTENNFTFLSNELTGAMLKISHKHNLTHIAKTNIENTSFDFVPGKNVVDNIMRYSKAVEVVKNATQNPIFLIRN